MTDTELLDWLQAHEGWGLISDDAGRWACSGEGTQEVPNPEPGEATDIWTSFFIEAPRWKPSVREAIQDAVGREVSEE